MPLISSTPSNDVLYGLGITIALIVATKAVAHQLRHIVELNEIHVQPGNDKNGATSTTKKIPKELPLTTLATLLKNPSHEIRDAATKLLLPRFLASTAATARLAALNNASTNPDEASREEARHMVSVLGPALRERRGDEDIDILEALGSGPDNEELLALWEEVVGEQAGADQTIQNLNRGGRRRALEPQHPLMSIVRAHQEGNAHVTQAVQAAVENITEPLASQGERSRDADELVVVMQRGEDNGVTVDATPADVLTDQAEHRDDVLIDPESSVTARSAPHADPIDAVDPNDHTTSTPPPPTLPGRWVLHEQNEEMWLEREQPPLSPSAIISQATEPDDQPQSSGTQPVSTNTFAVPRASRTPSPPPSPSFMPDYNIPPLIPSPPMVHRSIPQASLLTSIGIENHTITLYNEDGYVVGQEERDLWERKYGDSWRRMRELTGSDGSRGGRNRARGNIRGFRRGGRGRRGEIARSVETGWGGTSSAAPAAQAAAAAADPADWHVTPVNEEAVQQDQRGWGETSVPSIQNDDGLSYAEVRARQRRREAVVVGSSIEEFEAQLEGDGWD